MLHDISFANLNLLLASIPVPEETEKPKDPQDDEDEEEETEMGGEEFKKYLGFAE